MGWMRLGNPARCWPTARWAKRLLAGLASHALVRRDVRAALALALLCGRGTAAVAEVPDRDDAVESAVHLALVGALAASPEALARAETEIRIADATRAGLGRPPTGLLDNLLTLGNAVRWAGDPRFSPEQRRAARLAGTPEERRLLAALADEEPWATVARLRWENRYNRIASGVNWLLRRTSQILTGQLQALLLMVNDVAFSHRAFLYPTARERKIRVLAAQVAAEAPGTPQAREARRLVEAIERKIERDRHRDLERRARVASQQGQWETAQALAESGLALWPGDSDFTAALREADHHLALRRRSWERSLLVLPTGEASLGESEWEEIASALRATLAEDARRLSALDRPASSEAVALLAAAAAARAGDWAESRERLERVAEGDGHAAWLARTCLARPPFEPAREVRDAVARRRALTRRFVWQGARGVEENLYLASSSVISQGLAAPAALGFFFFVDSAIRAVALSIHNPLGAEGVVDALAALERRQGGLSEEQWEMLRDRLTDLGAFDRALEAHAHLRTPDPRVAERLDRRIARQLLQAAERSESADTRRRLLTHLVQAHPDTPAAADAWRLLHAEPAEGIHLDVDAVRRSGAALIAAGWPLPLELWDGDLANGEIDAVGVWVGPDGAVRHRRRGARVWETVAPDPGVAARVVAAAQAAAAREARLEALDERRRPRVPLEITGSLGASGVYAAPQLQRFRRIDEDLPLYE